MFNASTALAIEKECAADAISEIFASVKTPFLPYVEKVVVALLPGLKHGWHDGIRKSAAAALLNFISTFHDIDEGPKWSKGASVRSILFCTRHDANSTFLAPSPCQRRSTRFCYSSRSLRDVV